MPDEKLAVGTEMFCFSHHSVFCVLKDIMQKQKLRKNFAKCVNAMLNSQNAISSAATAKDLMCTSS